jgi:hypothetical protein
MEEQIERTKPWNGQIRDQLEGTAPFFSGSVPRISRLLLPAAFFMALDWAPLLENGGKRSHFLGAKYGAFFIGSERAVANWTGQFPIPMEGII